MKKIHHSKVIPGFKHDPKSGAFIVINTEVFKNKKSLKQTQDEVAQLKAELNSLKSQLTDLTDRNKSKL